MSKMKALVKPSLTKIKTETKVDSRTSKTFWQLEFHLKDIIFLVKFKYQNGYAQICFHIVPIIPCQSQKGLYISNKSRDGKICNNFLFPLTWLCPCFTDVMTKKGQFRVCKFTFVWIEFEVNFP